jgi:ssDNA-binding Zn-finger/Zn-ribbon topoisomerase 1
MKKNNLIKVIRESLDKSFLELGDNEENTCKECGGEMKSVEVRFGKNDFISYCDECGAREPEARS